MIETVLALNLLLGFLGLRGLCLTMRRHHEAAYAVPPSPRRAVRLRAGGWTMIALSLWVAIRSEGAAIGPVQWVCALVAAGLALNVLLSYRPGMVRWAGWASLPALVWAAGMLAVA